MDHNCSCHDEPLTRDDVLDLAYTFLNLGSEEAMAGRVAEADCLNRMAQVAISLAERTIPATLSGPVH